MRYEIVPKSLRIRPKIVKLTVRLSLFVPLFIMLFYLPLNHKGITKNTSVDEEEYIRQRDAWVDKTFNTLTEDEKIGQLFMIRAHSDKGSEHIKSIENLIKDYKVGGLCFFQGTPEKQVELLNKYQALSPKIPLMVSMDAEWGLGMRFKKNAVSFPRQLMLGAIQNDKLVYDFGKEVARELKRIGVHINFAPVVDVNNNPSNPVINDRSFGEDRYNVTAKSYMYMMGMQDHGVMACAKHFPGHGDTDVDSHYDLPVIKHGRQRLDSIELYPFKVLSQHGIQSMMVAHLAIPAIDKTANLPMTLSSAAVTDLLKDEVDFQGLIFTDGLGMKGVTKHHKPGQLEVKALKAGNDVLLLPQDVAAAHKQIKEALFKKELDRTSFENSVKKVLAAKYKLGLTSFSPVSTSGIREDISGEQARSMKRKLVVGAMTLVRDDAALMPFKDLSGRSFATLSIGSASLTPFQKQVSKYVDASHYNTTKSVSNASSLLSLLKGKETVFVSLHGMSSSASKEFGITPQTVSFLQKLSKQNKVFLVVFGNPYALRYFDNVGTVLQCYNDEDMTQEVAAQSIFGTYPISGRLPVTASPRSRFDDGMDIAALGRLEYDIPESAGLDSRILRRIDTIAQEAISKKATPGLQVLVARQGKVVFHKAYGHHTRSKKKRVSLTDIYDVASVTKVMASTISLMQLTEEGKVNINANLGSYLNAAKGTNKENLVIRDILAHHARLKSWIPFYVETVTKSKKNPRPKKEYYRKTKGGEFNTQVTDKLYMKDSYKKEMWKQIWESELRTKTGYKYSDLGFYMAAALVEEQTGKPLDQFADETFYKPLGLQATTFNPREKFPVERIIPSENDKYFRRQNVQGHVHDMGAAMLGGVSGHAGLFTTTNDLAVLSQMLLNGGYYGGRNYLNPSTIQTFTTRHYASTRRGIGFDMKERDGSRSQNMAPEASDSTYGHLGFTGTAVWIDPEKELFCIFLSNRTHPGMNNYKLNKLDIRPRVQTAVYDAILPDVQ